MVTENREVQSIPIPREMQDIERFRARRAVARWATSASDARDLLEMLDLIPREGETR